MADSGSSLSPEKRLLNLIEGSGKGGASSAAPKTAAVVAEPVKAASPKAGPVFSRVAPAEIKERLLKIFNDAKLYVFNFKNRFGISSANKTARIFLAFFAVVTLGNALYEMKVSERDPLAGLDVPERKVTKIDLEEPVFDAGALQTGDSRNAFLPFSKREEIQAVQQTSSGGGKLVEMTKNLKLTGISFNPDDAKVAYCMIEDLSKSITLFLHVGDHVSGMRVAKILEESVELEYENEKIEIH